MCRSYPTRSLPASSRCSRSAPSVSATRPPERRRRLGAAHRRLVRALTAWPLQSDAGRVCPALRSLPALLTLWLSTIAVAAVRQALETPAHRHLGHGPDARIKGLGSYKRGVDLAAQAARGSGAPGSRAARKHALSGLRVFCSIVPDVRLV